jgi:DNA polymerase elongation subunit (family B)
MSHFYSNVQQYGNRLLVREIKNGHRSQRKIDFTPTLFVKAKGESKYKSIYGTSLDPIKFLDINDAKKFVRDYDDVDNFEIFGNTSYAYQYITETFPRDIDYDLSQLLIYTIDIETASEYGFPNVDSANEEVLLITVQDYTSKKIVTFGSRKFNTSKISHITNPDKYQYVYCQDERELLKSFLSFWLSSVPDAVTGWNIQMFDIPYLVNRINNILGPEFIQQLSPWKNVAARTISLGGKDYNTYDIYGVSILDYLDVYKKFTYKAHESYKLDYIASVELGRKKLQTEYETFKDFYTKDWHNFVEYNVIDVELVDALEDKMKLIELMMTMAYDAKCNFNDVYSAVRTWDCILYNHLWNKNIVVQPKKHKPSRHIIGAYVMEPKPGKYDWVVSFDAASLYPSIIMQYNMSPETLVEGAVLNSSPDDLLNGKVDHRALLQKEDYAMAANGYCYTRKKQGLFPEIVEKIFSERVFYKKKMIEAEKDYQLTNDAQTSKLISKYNNIQMARKIQLNSLYGALANQYFRFYDDRIAEGITLSGQYIIQHVGHALDNYLNEACNTRGEQYTFYSDTDSCYVTMKNVVNKFLPNQDKNKVIKLLNKISNDKLVPTMNKACEEIAAKTNAFQQKMQFKREIIADAGIWVAKKRYALNVFDSEGVQYTEPKLKAMGLEIVRSSTPAPVRQYLRDAVKIALTGSEAELQTFIADIETKFNMMCPEEIAFPRGANSLNKYSSSSSIYIKATPMQVRGALLYNYYIQRGNLDKKYELIKEGEKIKYVYLKQPNHIRENCIAFPSVLPKELDLHRHVDYITMFEKSFLDPLLTVVNTLGWNVRPQATLDLLF